MILLVLNTMYWNDNRYTDPLVDQIAESQMQWFNDQLQMAKKQRKKVLIMSHIPPGWVDLSVPIEIEESNRRITRNRITVDFTRSEIKIVKTYSIF